MRLTVHELSEIEGYLQGMHLTEEAECMKRFIQHGSISTYDHVKIGRASCRERVFSTV